jgi:hypothetical protein
VNRSFRDYCSDRFDAENISGISPIGAVTRQTRHCAFLRGQQSGVLVLTRLRCVDFIFKNILDSAGLNKVRAEKQTPPSGAENRLRKNGEQMAS